MARFRRRFRRFRFRQAFSRFRSRWGARYRSFRARRRRTYGSRKKNKWITYVIGLLILGGAGFFVWKKFIKKV